jgi:hypothetical protein
MGLFGYRKFPTTPDEYKGFIFRIELDHDKKSILPTGTDINNDNYRFPIKFGLYDVHRTVSSLSQTKHGWDSKNTIFEYDYINFNFYKPVQTKSIKVTDNLVIPVKQSSDISLDSEIGSMFFCPDL